MEQVSTMQMAESDARKRRLEQEFEILKAAKQLDDWEKVKKQVKRPVIINPELHKKTYFNAVEKLLLAP